MRYELSNHLGNVLVTISDKKLKHETEDHYYPDVINFTDYYAFGMAMPNRTGYVKMNSATPSVPATVTDNAGESYRYAFNGMERDKQEWNTGEIYDTDYRSFDPRICRWLSPDPFGQYPSPYVAMGNNPICLSDLSGGWATGPEGGDGECHDAQTGELADENGAPLMNDHKWGALDCNDLNFMTESGTYHDVNRLDDVPIIGSRSDSPTPPSNPQLMAPAIPVIAAGAAVVLSAYIMYYFWKDGLGFKPEPGIGMGRYEPFSEPKAIPKYPATPLYPAIPRTRPKDPREETIVYEIFSLGESDQPYITEKYGIAFTKKNFRKKDGNERPEKQVRDFQKADPTRTYNYKVLHNCPTRKIAEGFEKGYVTNYYRMHGEMPRKQFLPPPDTF